MRMSWADTHTLLSTLRGLLTVHPITIETHDIGLALAERYGLSTFDAMIAASALHARCDALWSEDMQHGMVLDQGLRIANPFLGGG
jgi:predicted nucleic acid-binding protein